MRQRVGRRVPLFGLALAPCLSLAIAPPVLSSPEESPQAQPTAQERSPGAPDFLLGAPHGSVGLRTSWLFASAGSDLFGFVTERLTIGDRDFDAPALALEVAVAVSPRVELLAGIEYSSATMRSEYRDYIDNLGHPIAQQTELEETDVSASVRLWLVPRGRAVSRLAWVPRAVAPYVGAGGGMLWYAFKQHGDFVDFASLDVFSDAFSSRGWSPSVHAFGGVAVQVYRALFVTAEARYLWAAADLDGDFVGFDPIDLAGLRVGMGVNVSF